MDFHTERRPIELPGVLLDSDTPDLSLSARVTVEREIRRRGSRDDSFEEMACKSFGDSGDGLLVIPQSQPDCSGELDMVHYIGSEDGVFDAEHIYCLNQEIAVLGLPLELCNGMTPALARYSLGLPGSSGESLSFLTLYNHLLKPRPASARPCHCTGARMSPAMDHDSKNRRTN